jgi:predicted kinase
VASGLVLERASNPPPPFTLFFLSPAFLGGERASLVFRPSADFPLARQLRSADGVALGELFSFLSGLYFRGKVAYAQAFGKAPEGLPAALVMSPGEGLRFLHERITLARLEAWAEVAIDEHNPHFTEPLIAHASALEQALQGKARFVLLGSVATDKYVRPLGQVFAERLLFPEQFVGRGDMSRGSLMLRAARAGQELEYAPVAGARRHGPRPAALSSRLPPAPAAAFPAGLGEAEELSRDDDVVPREELAEEESELELVILIGLPGAGKSTFFRQRFAETHRHLSRDDLRRRREPQRRHAELLRQALSERRSVVVDDTNVTREQRAPAIAEGQRQGARVVGYFFDCPVRDCSARNRQREGSERIPEAGLLSSAKRLVRPALDEGFDELHTVQVLPGLGFEISAPRTALE